MVLTIRWDNNIPGILNSMIDGVIVCDKEARITMANKAAENLFLAREGSLLNIPLRQASNERAINNMIDGVLSTGKEVFAETRFDSNNRFYRVHAVALTDVGGDILGAVAVFHDVTEARNFDQMRSEFVGNVSHELRTPLTSIKGFVETLLDGALANTDTCRRFLSIIDTETERLNRLIEDLLTLSSIESKERRVKPVPVSLVRVIRNVTNIMSPQISEKRLHVEFIYTDGLEPVMGDEDLIGQVFINLLDNAIKYSPRGGKIIIRSRRREHRVVTTIRDTGMGIPRESISRIFERFYRVDKARSRRQGGTGLGLAIVKHIVESHGGEVFVDSEIGKGATFGVSFLVV